MRYFLSEVTVRYLRSLGRVATIRSTAPTASDLTLGQAEDAYLATLHGSEQASTWRTYGRILHWVVTEFGADADPDKVSAERFAAWFTAQWAECAPSTWNVTLDAIRSAAAYWQCQGWIGADPSRLLQRRRPRPRPVPRSVPCRGRAAAHPSGRQPP